jgi:tRNA threonylcarbamoyladenosine biosynthesis protein TsaE
VTARETAVQTVELAADSAEQTRDIGRRLGALLRAGDLVVLTGDLGAGKTTFAQGIGAGLRVRGDVTSPTFVISRVHPSLVDGPPLVHVDAYRIAGSAELDDLDLDETLEAAVTVVEWGAGLAEGLADHRVSVTLLRSRGDDVPVVIDGDEPRTITIEAIGTRWAGVGLRESLDGGPGNCS